MVRDVYAGKRHVDFVDSEMMQRPDDILLICSLFARLIAALDTTFRTAYDGCHGFAFKECGDHVLVYSTYPPQKAWDGRLLPLNTNFVEMDQDELCMFLLAKDFPRYQLYIGYQFIFAVEIPLQLFRWWFAAVCKLANDEGYFLDDDGNLC